jgi:hypothetical protein
MAHSYIIDPPCTQFPVSEEETMTTISNFGGALSYLAKRRSFLLGLIGIPAAAAAAPAPAPTKAIYEKSFDGFDGKTLEQKVQEIADREEIKELVSRYAHRVARGVSVADLYTDDGAYIHRRPGQPVQETRGRAALDKHYAASADVVNQGRVALPMIHNHLIEVSGNTASGLCSIELRTADKGQSIIASGYYEDTYRRENGRWKFVVRDAHMFHWVPLQEGWANPKAP